MDTSEHLGHDHPDGCVEVNERHDHGDRRDEESHLPGQPAGRSFFLLNILLRLPEGLLGDDRFLIFFFPLLFFHGSPRPDRYGHVKW